MRLALLSLLTLLTLMTHAGGNEDGLADDTTVARPVSPTALGFPPRLPGCPDSVGQHERPPVTPLSTFPPSSEFPPSAQPTPVDPYYHQFNESFKAAQAARAAQTPLSPTDEGEEDSDPLNTSFLNETAPEPDLVDGGGSQATANDTTTTGADAAEEESDMPHRKKPADSAGFGIHENDVAEWVHAIRLASADKYVDVTTQIRDTALKALKELIVNHRELVDQINNLPQNYDRSPEEEADYLLDQCHRDKFGTIPQDDTETSVPELVAQMYRDHVLRAFKKLYDANEKLLSKLNSQEE